MTVGLSGSQTITGWQETAIEAALRALYFGLGETELHHGDCVGADAHAHRIALDLGYAIVVHPPLDEKARAFCSGPPGQVEILDPEEYMHRNFAIANAATVVLATPDGKERQRSGTWSTVRRARRLCVPVWVCGPDDRRFWPELAGERVPG